MSPDTADGAMFPSSRPMSADPCFCHVCRVGMRPHPEHRGSCYTAADAMRAATRQWLVTLCVLLAFAPLELHTIRAHDTFESSVTVVLLRPDVPGIGNSFRTFNQSLVSTADVVV